MENLYQQRNNVETQLSQKITERKLILKQLITKQDEIDVLESQHNQLTTKISNQEREQWGDTSEMSIDSQIPFERRRQRKLLLQEEIGHLKKIRNQKQRQVRQVLAPSYRIIGP